MRRLIVCFLILSLIALPVLPVIPGRPADTTTLAAGAAVTGAASPFGAASVAQGGEPSTPGPDLGVANYTANWLGNPDFETWVNSYTPTYWGVYESGDAYGWYAQAPWPVNESSQSAGMQVRSQTPGMSDYTYMYQGGFSADAVDLNLTFSWYVDQNPDPAVNHDFARVYLRFNDGFTNYYLYYFLNGSTTNVNTSTSGYYFLDAPSQQWNQFRRNVSADFEAISTFPSLTSSFVVNRIRFRTETKGWTTQYTRVFIDDLHLINESNAYVWIGGATRNGNFEGSSDWVFRTRDAGFVRQSTTAYTGTYCANLTAASTGNSSIAQVDAYYYPRITAQNQGNVSLWWYLDYQNPGIGTYTYVNIGFYNGTGSSQHYFNIYYLIGYGGGVRPYSNSTYILMIDADNYNTEDDWVFFRRNPWVDASSYYTNLAELHLDHISIFTATTGPGSRATVLIDTTRLNAAAVNGGSYEDQLNVGQSIHAWGYPWNQPLSLTVTDTSYAGSKAANLTLVNGQTFSESQFFGGRSLNGSRETYLDVMWRLQAFTPGVNDYTYLRIHLLDGRSMYYYIAATSGFIPSNSSNAVVYNVTGVNTLDTWIQMHRDLAHDYKAWFGSLPNTGFNYIMLSGASSTGNRLELLFDDFYLYDDPAPRISNIDRVPTSPEYGELVTVTADVEDQDLDTVQMHYRLDGAAWQTLLMSETVSYEADIPGQPYDTQVEYFLTANDSWGLTSTDDNGGSYYSYTVGDSVDPILSSIGHTPVSPQYTESVTVNCTATDGGSGIGSVQLFYRLDGGSWVPTAMSEDAPDEYEATILAQAWATLVEYYVTATDGAGNPVTDDNGGSYYSYTVGDTINPTVAISAPTDGGTVSGLVTLTFTVSDPGSAVASVALHVNGSVEATDTSEPFSLTWDSTTVADGVYVLQVVATDNAGNSGSDSVTVIVSNYAPLPLLLSPLLIGGIIAVIVIIIVLLWYFVFRRRSK